MCACVCVCVLVMHVCIAVWEDPWSILQRWDTLLQGEGTGKSYCVICSGSAWPGQVFSVVDYIRGYSHAVLYCVCVYECVCVYMCMYVCVCMCCVCVCVCVCVCTCSCVLHVSWHSTTRGGYWWELLTFLLLGIIIIWLGFASPHIIPFPFPNHILHLATV